MLISVTSAEYKDLQYHHQQLLAETVGLLAATEKGENATSLAEKQAAREEELKHLEASSVHLATIQKLSNQSGADDAAVPRLAGAGAHADSFMGVELFPGLYDLLLAEEDLEEDSPGKSGKNVNDAVAGIEGKDDPSSASGVENVDDAAADKVNGQPPLPAS